MADWMQTYTGRAFYPLAPCAEDVDPRDIAHALSLICRYGGHVDRFYSVAEHCVLLSHYVREEHALWALLHDATEAYVGDMVRPLKRSMPAYRRVEDRVMSVICEAFGLGQECPLEVKDADDRILLDERAALMRAAPPSPWVVDVRRPLGVDVVGFEPAEAEALYLDRLAQLTGVAASSAATGEVAERVGLNPDAHPCGHQRSAPGCGGCDPGAVAAVMEDSRPGIWRSPQPDDFASPAPTEEAGR